MSFDIFKTRRSTEYWNDQNTPAKLGPGSYNLNKVPFSSKKIKGIGSFSSIQERFPSTAPQSARPATNQGSEKPLIQTSFIQGRNLQQIFEVLPQQQPISQSNSTISPKNSFIQKYSKSSSSFLSKVQRLAPPTALLGSEFPASNYDNPGPGSYDYNQRENNKNSIIETMKDLIKEQQENKKKKIMQAIIEIEGDQVIKKKKKVKPTIPGKKAHKNGYTGIDQDTPGPSGYNPNAEIIKLKSASSLFSKSKTAREVFQVSKQTNLGPQSYIFDDEKLIKKDHSKKGQNSIFQSRVPNCKDKKIDNSEIPGPGSYDPLDQEGANIGGEYEQDKSKVSEALQLKNVSYLKKSLNQPTIMRKLDCPFIDSQEKTMAPGPGNYFYDNAKDKIFKRIQSQLNEQICHPKPPFNSQLERDCLKALEKTQQIGPGSYIDINNPNNSSLNKTLLKFQTDLNFKKTYGIEVKPFGSSSQRIVSFAQGKNETLQPSSSCQLEEQNFGLASQFSLVKQEEDAIRKAGQSEKYSKIRQSKSQGSFQFKSKAKRIFYQDQNDPNVVSINTNIEQNLMNIIKQNLDCQDNQSHLRFSTSTSNRVSQPLLHKQNQLTQCVQKMKNVYFDSTTERFCFSQYAKSALEQTPGPGSYDHNSTSTRPDTKNSMQQVQYKKQGFQTSEKKFNPNFNSYVKRQATNQKIGPGSYYNPDNISMVKKSFNMAIEGSSYV